MPLVRTGSMGPALARLFARPSPPRLLRPLIDNTRPRERGCRCFHDEKLERGTRYGRRGVRRVVTKHEHLQEPGQATEDVRRTLVTDEESARLALPWILNSGTTLEDINPEGKKPFEWLRDESDVCSRAGKSTRLVDRAEYKHDMSLWLQLLLFRKEMDGPRGVKMIWQGMRDRKVALPTKGDVADTLWPAFISAAAADPPFMSRHLSAVYKHAKELHNATGECFSGLYKHIVGSTFREKPEEVLRWHNRMEADGLLPENALSIVAIDAIDSIHPDSAFTRFEKMLVPGQQQPLYDICISAFLDRADFDTALRWHKLLSRRGYLPSAELQAHATVQQLFIADAPASLSSKKAKAEASSDPADIVFSGHSPVLTRENMSRIVGDVHGIKQKNISDQFCARLFATRSFSVDMISGGLKLFGLQEVGPLALREIAARSEDTSDFLRALAALKEVSIGVPESAFAEALQVFAKQRRQDHFDFIVKSDMHPDSYEDVELQKKLYASFLASNRSVESEATLTILTMLGENLEGETWNHMLQHHCKRSSWHKVYQTVREMLDKRLPFSDDSLDLLHRKCLRPRAPGKRPLAIQPIVPRGVGDLESMSNVFRSIMRSGQELEPTRWREIIRRYCICGQMRGLENLTLWLAAWYAPKGRSITRPKLADLRQGYKVFIPDKMDLPIAVSSSHPSHPLQQLFDARTQIAIVMAGFESAAPTRDNESSLSASERNATHYRLNLTRSWARGVLLLKRLKKLGVLVHTPLVRKAVILELWKLYGPATSKVKRNRFAKEFNNMTLAHMVAHLEHVWAGTEYGTLFQLPSHLLASDTASSKEELYVAVFGEHRRISLQSKGKYDIASVATGAPRVIRQWDIDTQYEEEL